MTERQKKLVRDYGPRFLERAHKIKTEFLYLPSDAISVLTDEEWRLCAEQLVTFLEELNKVEELVVSRIEEAGVTLE